MSVSVPAGAERLDRSGEIFALIRHDRARTIAELAAATALARSTVSARVELLLSAGLVLSGPADPGPNRILGRGRPPSVLRFNPAFGVVLVAHLGLSATRIGVADLAGKLLADAVVERPMDDDPTRFLAHLAARWTTLLRSRRVPRSRVRGVAVGLPAPTELAVARAHHGRSTQPWVSFPVAAHLRESFGVPVALEADVNLLAIAEQRLCRPQDTVVVCVKAGTVIGCGVTVDGRVVRGAQSLAGGIGHTLVAGRNEPCHCGNRGCLDAVAGGAALTAELRAAGHDANDIRDVARMAADGVLPAVQAVRGAGRNIGEVLAGVVNLLNPDAIAVWGYLIEAEEVLLAGMRETLYQGSWPGSTRSLSLGAAGLGHLAGLRGAAMTIAEDILSPASVDHLLAVG